jgi:hypothetical protein
MRVKETKPNPMGSVGRQCGLEFGLCAAIDVFLCRGSPLFPEEEDDEWKCKTAPFLDWAAVFQFSPRIFNICLYGPLGEIIIRPLHCGAFYTKVLGL